MDLRIKSSDYEMTRETTEYLNDKLVSVEKILASDADTARCEVELGRAIGHSQQGNVWRAEIIVIRGRERAVAEAFGENVHAAIDLAKDEILQQLRKQKGRSWALTKRMGARLKQLARRG